MMVYVVSVGVFSGIIMGLVALVMGLEKRLRSGALCHVIINNSPDNSPRVPAGTTLLAALANNGIFVPSACGGSGSCGLCKVQVTDGGGELSPTELPHLSRQERRDQVRLSCQMKVKNDMRIRVSDAVFSVKKFKCVVTSNDNVATFIKELKLALPESLDMAFRAGGYIQIDIPPYQELAYRSFDIAPRFQDEWRGLQGITAHNDTPTFRAYSMANYPEERGIITLNVRVATPPRGKTCPPGIGSSYIFGLKPGDTVMVSGPYGEFYAKDTDREMCFIGGGAGMAPMRSHIFDQLKRLKSNRKITFWYGARSKREMFYDDEFQQLQADNPQFSYHVALSDPQPGDDWSGHTGFIHQVLHDTYLAAHDDPSDVEFYICGPPMMLTAVTQMLDSLGVEPDMIAYDDFGS